jgi:hypothetical protein
MSNILQGTLLRNFTRNLTIAVRKNTNNRKTLNNLSKAEIDDLYVLVLYCILQPILLKRHQAYSDSTPIPREGCIISNLLRHRSNSLKSSEVCFLNEGMLE